MPTPDRCAVAVGRRLQRSDADRDREQDHVKKRLQQQDETRGEQSDDNRTSSLKNAAAASSSVRMSLTVAQPKAHPTHASERHEHTESERRSTTGHTCRITSPSRSSRRAHTKADREEGLLRPGRFRLAGSSRFIPTVRHRVQLKTYVPTRCTSLLREHINEGAHDKRLDAW